MPHPFAVGDAAAIEKLFADQIRALSPRFNSPVWRGRAVALVGCVLPTLVWLRDHKGVRLDFEVVRFATDLRWITKAALEGIVLLRDAASGDVTEWTSGAKSPIKSSHPCDATSPRYPATTSPFPWFSRRAKRWSSTASCRCPACPASTSTTLRHSHGRRPPDAKSGCRSRSLLS